MSDGEPFAPGPRPRSDSHTSQRPLRCSCPHSATTKNARYQYIGRICVEDHEGNWPRVSAAYRVDGIAARPSWARDESSADRIGRSRP